MKSLQESLFDKDLDKKELPIQNILKNFDSDSLQELSVEDRNAAFEQLFDMGKQYNAAELRKTPVDLSKNVLITRRDKLHILSPHSEPCRYIFVYINPKDGRIMHANLLDILIRSNDEKYYWDANCKVVIACSPAWYQEQHRILKYPKMQLSQL